jgi:ribose-phosphate pyrophosphokinase
MPRVLYTLAVHQRLAGALRELAGFAAGGSVISRFSNGELHVELEASPAGCECIVLGAVAPPDEHLLATLLLSHTLKKEGARTVTACLPYLGYARHDRAERRKSRATAWLGEVLRASGVDSVVAIDVHSPLAHELFPIAVGSLSPAALFGRAILECGLSDPAVVAPDAGALDRCESVRRAAGIQRPLAHLTKTRTPDGVRHSILNGAVGSQAIVVDDILDTGGTLLSACETLQTAGAREIVIMTTHGLFTGSAWQRLWSLGVARIYTTDSTPLPESVSSSERIVVLPVAPLLAEALGGREEKHGEHIE